ETRGVQKYDPAANRAVGQLAPPGGFVQPHALQTDDRSRPATNSAHFPRRRSPSRSLREIAFTAVPRRAELSQGWAPFTNACRPAEGPAGTLHFGATVTG